MKEEELGREFSSIYRLIFDLYIRLLSTLSEARRAPEYTICGQIATLHLDLRIHGRYSEVRSESEVEHHGYKATHKALHTAG